MGFLVPTVVACVEPDIELRFKSDVPLPPGPCREPESVEALFFGGVRYQQRCDKHPKNCGLGKGPFVDLKWLNSSETYTTLRSISADGSVMLTGRGRLYDLWLAEELLPEVLHELWVTRHIFPSELTLDGKYLVAVQDLALSEAEAHDPVSVKKSIYLVQIAHGSLQKVVDLRGRNSEVVSVSDDAGAYWISEFDCVAPTEPGKEQDVFSKYYCPTGGQYQQREKIFDRATNTFSPYDESRWKALKATPPFGLISRRSVDPKNEEILSDGLDILDNLTQEEIDIPELNKISGIGGRAITSDGRNIFFDHLVSPKDRDLCILDRGPQ